MSLYKNNCSFRTLIFNNNFRMDGLIETMKEIKAPIIAGTRDLVSMGFCGHSPDMPEEFFHTSNLLGFSVKRFEKIIDKVELKKEFEKLHIEYNRKQKLTKDEKEELKGEALLRVSIKSAVRTKYIQCLIDIKEKRLFIQNTSINVMQEVLGFIEGRLGFQEIRTRSLFDESTKDKVHTFSQLQQLFLFWLYQITCGNLKDDSPFDVRITNKMKFKSQKSGLDLTGDVHKFSSLFNDLEGFKQLKIMKLGLFEKDEDSDGEEPKYFQTYGYEFKADSNAIFSFKDINFSKDYEPVSMIIARNASLVDLLVHLDVLASEFKKWINSVDPLEVLKELSGINEE